MTTVSADGRGRTFFQMLTGRNKKEDTPLEFQVHNPLKMKKGCSVSIDDPAYSGINFFVTSINVYETVIRGAGRKSSSFYHTDYCLRGVTMDQDDPIHMRLRLIPNSDTPGGYDLQLLRVLTEMEYDESFQSVLDDPTGVLWYNYDDNGNELENPLEYHRIDGVSNPYKANLTMLEDSNNDGKISADELKHFKITYWDYSTIGVEGLDPNSQEVFVYVEMDDDTRYSVILRGVPITLSQVMVI